MFKSFAASDVLYVPPSRHTPFIERHGRIIRQNKHVGEEHRYSWQAYDRYCERLIDGRRKRLIEAEAAEQALHFVAERRRELAEAAARRNQVGLSADPDFVDWRSSLPGTDFGIALMYKAPTLRAHIDVPVVIRRSRAASLRAALASGQG